MTIDRGRCPPAPPASITGRLLTVDLDPNPDELVRLHWRGKAPLGFGIAKRGNRFDPLGKPYEHCKVLYSGTTLEVAIAETVLRWHGQLAAGTAVELSNATHLKDRQVARFRPGRSLKIIDATGLGLDRIQAAVNATVALPAHSADWASRPPSLADDIFQCAADEYSMTQAWGAWFRAQCPDADGLQWISRQFNRGRCFVLFNDRCEHDLEQIGDSTNLIAAGSVEEATLDGLLEQLGWTRS